MCLTGNPRTNQAASLQLLQSWDRQRGLARLEEQSHTSCGARDVPRLLLGRLRVNIREVSPGGLVQCSETAQEAEEALSLEMSRPRHS